MQILIFGNGYIGKRCASIWGNQATLSTKRIHSVCDVLDELSQKDYDVVLNATGTKGFPNVDWCESNQLLTAYGNIQLPLIIAEACAIYGVYLLHIGSGCVFYGKSPDPQGWKEDDFANPISYYSKTKYAVDLALSSLPNVGIARIRIPLDDHPCHENIIDKLVKYDYVADISNSISYLPDAINVFYMLMMNQAEGIYHVVNPGTVSYKELINLYKEKINPQHHTNWISEDELLNKGFILKKRSTIILQSTRLEKLNIHMLDSGVAMRFAMDRYKNFLV